ncbi:unnamed protein product [Rotaria magnacalcarata]|uniref:Integrase catalytic domain-containing protein n=4 Tax=Rotaria magnacalcarata TaxID=392030 RepID=A0A816Z9J8_9BILA|nr:unnamed protein product [Rotaria magnacalcarata]
MGYGWQPCPQSNMTERVNRTLKPLIAIYAQQQPTSWDKEIQKIAYAIRTAVNETTGETPAFMMFGRDPRGPLDLLIGERTEDAQLNTDEHGQIQEYKKNLINNLRYAYNIVKEHAEIEKLKQKGKYDRHTTDRRYTEGDLVWVAIPTKQIGENSIAGKLQPHYQGPCRLIKQLTPSTFTVLRINDNVQLGATNTDRLKPYCEPIINKRNTTVTENDQTTNERQRTTTNINDESMDDDLNLQNVKENNPSTCDAPPQRRMSNRHHRVPIRYIEN